MRERRRDMLDHFLVVYRCMVCGEVAAIFPQHTLPLAIEAMGQEEGLRISPKDLKFRNLKMYCSGCTPLGTLRVEGTCHVCNCRVDLYISRYADVVLVGKEPVLARMTPKMFAAGGKLAWCSEEHLGQDQKGRVVEKRELALV